MHIWLSPCRREGFQPRKQGSQDEAAWGKRMFLELLKVWMMPTPWLCDLGESLSLSELQFLILGYKTTTTPSHVV